jgi:hypothetical protein
MLQHKGHLRLPARSCTTYKQDRQRQDRTHDGILPTPYATVQLKSAASGPAALFNSFRAELVQFAPAVLGFVLGDAEADFVAAYAFNIG